MADAATPSLVAASAAAASGALSIPVLATAMGLDAASMGSGLLGVVIAQTLLPRTTQSILSVSGLAVGSMLLASISSPFVAPALINNLPNWQWLQLVEPGHVKAAAATFVGGFAQPLMLWLRVLVGRWLPSATPSAAPKE
jgi:hypothetical protein